MIGESTVKLTIALQDSDLDEEELDKLTRNLLQGIKDRRDGVENSSLTAITQTPQGAKLFGRLEKGILQAEVSSGNLKKLIGFVGGRLGYKSIDFKVQAKGKNISSKPIDS